MSSIIHFPIQFHSKYAFSTQFYPKIIRFLQKHTNFYSPKLTFTKLFKNSKTETPQILTNPPKPCKFEILIPLAKFPFWGIGVRSLAFKFQASLIRWLCQDECSCNQWGNNPPVAPKWPSGIDLRKLFSDFNGVVFLRVSVTFFEFQKRWFFSAKWCKTATIFCF